jgi:hypothetical protein
MSRKRRLTPFFLSLLVLLISSCRGEEAIQPLLLDTAPEILDATHMVDGEYGNEHFFWLPPMTSPAPQPSGDFEAGADPTVLVHSWSPTLELWTDTGIRFSLGSGLDQNLIDEWYGADWYVFEQEWDVAEGDLFRISVRASGQELGFADLLIVDKVTGQMKKTLGDDFVLMSERNGRKFLNIRFRIERGAIVGPGQLYRMATSEVHGGFVMGIYDITDLGAIHPVTEFRPAAYSSGFVIDPDGNLVQAFNLSQTRGSLRVYDPDLNLLGSVEVDPAAFGGVNSFMLGLDIGPSGRVYACNPARGPQARIFVFDVQEPTAPRLLNVEDIPPVLPNFGVECRGPTLDSDGVLWVFGNGYYGDLTKMTFDSEGDLTAYETFERRGGHYMAFEPGTQRLFWSWINNNHIQFVERSDPSAQPGMITDVCEPGAYWTPGYLKFDSRGNLFVGCSNYPEPYSTDLVVFTREQLAGLTLGATATAASLNPVRYEDEFLRGAGQMFIR